jgi:hypothetical protein
MVPNVLSSTQIFEDPTQSINVFHIKFRRYGWMWNNLIQINFSSSLEFLLSLCGQLTFSIGPIHSKEFGWKSLVGVTELFMHQKMSPALAAES